MLEIINITVSLYAVYKLFRLDRKMATAREALEGINEALNGLESDVNRLLDAVQNAGQLDAETAALADQVRARLSTVNDRMDAEVPETPVEPAPAPDEPTA